MDPSRNPTTTPPRRTSSPARRSATAIPLAEDDTSSETARRPTFSRVPQTPESVTIVKGSRAQVRPRPLSARQIKLREEAKVPEAEVMGRIPIPFWQLKNGELDVDWPRVPPGWTVRVDEVSGEHYWTEFIAFDIMSYTIRDPRASPSPWDSDLDWIKEFPIHYGMFYDPDVLLPEWVEPPKSMKYVRLTQGWPILPRIPELALREGRPWTNPFNATLAHHNSTVEGSAQVDSFLELASLYF